MSTNATQRDVAEINKILAERADFLSTPKTNGVGGEIVEPELPNEPAPLRGAAYHGLAGEIVKLIEPHSEADPAAIMLQFLAAYGSAIGRNSYWTAEADRHYGNLFVAIVGQSSKSRKGTSWSHVARLMSEADPEWFSDRVANGLSTGEGLIHHVRDPLEALEIADGEATGKMKLVDPGVEDKRLLIQEGELARTLRACDRHGSTLSPVIRNAWDGRKLSTLTKSESATATGAHVSIVGHITRGELLATLTKNDTLNGFANRFLWCYAKRSKLLPFGGGFDEVPLADPMRRLENALKHGRVDRKMIYTPKAKEFWRQVYKKLSDCHPGLLGTVTSRAEAQVLRVAMIYALLDELPVIDVDHIKAGFEVWRYCHDSASFVFGNSLGDPTADTILQALRDVDAGMSRTELRDLFGRNKSKQEMDSALSMLAAQNLVECRKVTTGSRGRPQELWFATGAYDINDKNDINSYVTLTQ